MSWRRVCRLDIEVIEPDPQASVIVATPVMEGYTACREVEVCFFADSEIITYHRQQ